MAYQGTLVFRLQEMDTTVLQHQQRLSDIDDKLANDTRIKLAQAGVRKAQSDLEPLQKQQRDIEHQIDAIRDKQQSTEKRLYSGTVKNTKEMRDMQQEIESLKRRLESLDDDLLEMMLAVEAAQEALDGKEAKLADVLKAAESDHADLLAEKRDLEAEINKLQDDRPGMAQSLNPDILTRYENLRPRKANRPVSLLRDGTNCSICGV